MLQALREIMGSRRVIHNLLWPFLLTPVDSLGTLAEVLLPMACFLKESASCSN